MVILSTSVTVRHLSVVRRGSLFRAPLPNRNFDSWHKCRPYPFMQTVVKFLFLTQRELHKILQIDCAKIPDVDGQAVRLCGTELSE